MAGLYDPTGVIATLTSGLTCSVAWTAPSGPSTPTSYSVYWQGQGTSLTGQQAYTAMGMAQVPVTVASSPASVVVPAPGNYTFLVVANYGGFGSGLSTVAGGMPFGQIPIVTNLISSNVLIVPYTTAVPIIYYPIVIDPADALTGLPPNGTIASNGTVTLGTALDQIYGPTNNNIPGIWLYFPTTAFNASYLPAGFYWCVMSSTTVGIVYSTAYTVWETSSIPKTALTAVTGSNSAYTQITGSYVYAPVETIPAGAMLSDSNIRATLQSSMNSTAGAKISNVSMSTASTMTSPAVISTLSVTTSTSSRQAGNASNVGALNSQVLIPAGTWGASSVATATAAINTANAWYVGCGLQIATATDWIICQSLVVEIML